MSVEMTVGIDAAAAREEEAALEDLEEGECSDDEELPPPSPVHDEPVKQEKEKEKKKDKEERKDKKHKRRSRSGSKERHKSKKHKKKKGKEKERIEEDEDDETAKKNAMLRKLKMLEGEMGLVESEGEAEEGSSGSRSPSPSGPHGNKRKREKAEREFGRKKWKGPQRRICNLYVQGKCPRDESECLFSHDVDVPKVWELCKFYVYDRCVKRDKCLYLHKEFPCKFYHTGIGCEETLEACKFSHEPLNDTTRNLLLKHVETAPKELLGDFPRMSRPEAWQSVSTTEAKNNGWTLPDNKQRPNSRWDVMPQFPHDFQQPGMGGDFMGGGGMNSPNQGMYNQVIKPWGIPKGNKANVASPTINNSPKPTDLMEIKLNESVIKKFLSSQKKEVEVEDVKEDGWGRGDGDETPEITPPVSPTSYQEEDSQVHSIPQEHLAMYNRIKQKQRENESNAVEEYDNSDYDQDNGENVINKADSGFKSDEPHPVPWGVKRQTSQPQEYPPTSQDQSSPKMASSSQNIFSKKGEKKDPRLHKVDPRKERLARKEEEERLEREKDERILNLDLDSVLNDLDLPPLTLSSPKPEDEDKYLLDKMGLPFKPHIYHVAKEIDASIHSHPLLEWALHPVDVPVRDYSSLRHHFSAVQQDLDPRLRKATSKSSLAVMKELPLPDFTSPKSDPRLKGRPDPRKQGNQVPASQETTRRSSEDSEGNYVYNPARELNKEKLPAQPPLPPDGPNHPQGQQEVGYDHPEGDGDGYGYPPDYSQGGDQYQDRQDQYYPDDYQPGEDQDYPDRPDPRGGADQMNFQQMHQMSMGFLKGMQQNMATMINQNPRPDFPGRDPRARPNHQPRGFGADMPRGFPPRPPRGQWNQRFGRPDFRGGRQDFRMPVGNQPVLSKRDPRVK